jgi:hypothetical protein
MLREKILRGLVFDLRFWYLKIVSICADNLAGTRTPKIMNFMTLFICCYFAVCSLTNSEVRTRDYIIKPSLNDKISNTNLLTEQQSASVAVCTALCIGRCACFGFNPQKGKCRIHQSCNMSDMTTDDAGWRYYSPQGMLSHTSDILCYPV